MILPEQKPWMDKSHFEKERLGKMNLINKNSIVGPQINNELTA